MKCILVVMKKPPLVVGNWKMYKTIAESLSFVRDAAPRIKVPAWIAAPYTAVYAASEAAKGSRLSIGAQNINEHEEGAFTGEIAPRMLKDAGAQFVLIGHSERRRMFHETDVVVNKKLARALFQGTPSILCIGETLEEKEKGETHAVLERQLSVALQGIDNFSSLMVAYEPVWAIGTGKTATTSYVQNIHAFCRSLLTGSVDILYGGSVSFSNVQEIVSLNDVDGVLVGGASLQVDSFVKIVELAAEAVS